MDRVLPPSDNLETAAIDQPDECLSAGHIDRDPTVGLFDDRIGVKVEIELEIVVAFALEAVLDEDAGAVFEEDGTFRGSPHC